MNGKKLLGGVALAGTLAMGWGVVSEADVRKGGKQSPDDRRDDRGHHGDERDHERALRHRLNSIAAGQQKILDVLQQFQQTTIPSQQLALESIAKVQTEILAEQATLLQEVGGLELACSTPDLVPVPLPGGGFCRRPSTNSNILQVPVYNQGGGIAGPSVTTVFFRVPPSAQQPNGVVQVDVATSPLNGFNGSGPLDFPIPSGCFDVDGICKFKIAVDAGIIGSPTVVESNEINNDGAGECAGTIL